jgi:hypothetical protein
MSVKYFLHINTLKKKIREYLKAFLIISQMFPSSQQFNITPSVEFVPLCVPETILRKLLRNACSYSLNF